MQSPMSLSLSPMSLLQPSPTAPPVAVSGPPAPSVLRLPVLLVVAGLLSLLAVTAYAQSGPSYMTYEKSVALLIGVSNYSPGWEALPKVAYDMDELHEVLADRTRPYPFTVTKLMNPKFAEIRNSLEDVLVNEDYPANSRLLIFMSGHGTRTRRGRNFFIAADSPSPADASAARGLSSATAISFDELVDQVLDSLFNSRNAPPQHILLVFDSCLAGDVFETTGSRKDLAKEIKVYMDNLNTNRQRYDRRKPVVTIMTSGSEGQKVNDDGFYVDQIIKNIAAPAGASQRALPATVLASRLFWKYSDLNREHIPLFGKYTPFLEASGRGEFVFWLPADPR